MTRAPRFVDTHCHLDLLDDFEMEAARRDAAGIWTLGVTTLPQAWSRNLDVASRHPLVEAALGLHPELVEGYSDAIEIWVALSPDARFIGEVGLDGRPKNRRSFDEQVGVFRRILGICSDQGDKILTVHSAGAQREVLDALEQALDLSRNQVVLHWFTGSRVLFDRATELGCFFSVNTAMLASARTAKVLAGIPKERILTESDAPFIDRGVGRMTAESLLEAELASALGMSADDLSAMIASNLSNLLASA